MKAIIVDDEPKAIELIKSYLQYFNSIELAATFRNGLKAFEYLNNNAIDLIFLDVNMPHLSGISLSKMIDPKTKIIFTTAYSEYAVESYNVEAVDYLLKPISLERFSKAISKVLSENITTNDLGLTPLLIKSGSKIFRINPEDILFLEKDGNYMTYHLMGQKVLARESVAESLGNLPAYFIQVHKSFIVNSKKVETIQKNEISINNQIITIGANYKDKIMKVLLD